MKVFVLAPNEDWICDRIVSEWYTQYPDISTKNPYEADIIWLYAGWCWNHIPEQLLQNKIVLCTEHHFVPEKFNEQKLNNFNYRDQFVNAYHVPNTHTQKYISNLTSKPVHVLPYWLNGSTWQPSDRDTSRALLNLAKDDFIVGSFQRDTEGGSGLPKLEKGPDLFCDYVEKLQIKHENLIVLLGGWRRSYVIERLESINIRYKYYEKNSLQNLKYMYAALDLYIISSRSEGGPQAVYEAAALKIPIISTDVGVVREILHPDCIIDIVKDVYEPTLESIDYNFKNVQKFNFDQYGEEYIKLLNYLKNNG